MRAQRPAGADGALTEWIDHSGTVYVNDPAAELPIEQGIRSDLPQFTSPGLDPSFLLELYTILLGRTAEDFEAGRVRAENPMRRAASAIPTPREHSIHTYVCCDDLCRLLAALDEPRAIDIAQRWQALLWPSGHTEHAEHTDHTELDLRHRLRALMLPQLARLAREAVSSGRKLMLRSEYRRRTRDAVTGSVRGSEETRH